MKIPTLLDINPNNVQKQVEFFEGRKEVGSGRTCVSLFFKIPILLYINPNNVQKHVEFFEGRKEVGSWRICV